MPQCLIGGQEGPCTSILRNPTAPPAPVIHGTADAAIDTELAQQLCSGLANCQPLVTIEGGGHACSLTHPTLVNLAVQQYLVELALGMPWQSERRGSGRLRSKLVTMADTLERK
jgi:hypothetical protein